MSTSQRSYEGRNGNTELNRKASGKLSNVSQRQQGKARLLVPVRRVADVPDYEFDEREENSLCGDPSSKLEQWLVRSCGLIETDSQDVADFLTSTMNIYSVEVLHKRLQEDRYLLSPIDITMDITHLIKRTLKRKYSKPLSELSAREVAVIICNHSRDFGISAVEIHNLNGESLANVETLQDLHTLGLSRHANLGDLLDCIQEWRSEGVAKSLLKNNKRRMNRSLNDVKEIIEHSQEQQHTNSSDCSMRRRSCPASDMESLLEKRIASDENIFFNNGVTYASTNTTTTTACSSGDQYYPGKGPSPVETPADTVELSDCSRISVSWNSAKIDFPTDAPVHHHCSADQATHASFAAATTAAAAAAAAAAADEEPHRMVEISSIDELAAPINNNPDHLSEVPETMPVDGPSKLLDVLKQPQQLTLWEYEVLCEFALNYVNSVEFIDMPPASDESTAAAIATMHGMQKRSSSRGRTQLDDVRIDINITRNEDSLNKKGQPTASVAPNAPRNGEVQFCNTEEAVERRSQRQQSYPSIKGFADRDLQLESENEFEYIRPPASELVLLAGDGEQDAVAAVGCYMIGVLCRNHPQNIAYFTSRSTASLVLEILSHFGASYTHVAEYGMFAFGSLLSTGKLPSDLEQYTDVQVEVVCSLMVTLLHLFGVQCADFAALGLIVYVNLAFHKNYRNALSSSPSHIDLLISVTKKHMAQHPLLLGYCLSALANLCYQQKRNMEIISDLGGRVLIMQALTKYCTMHQQIASSTMHVIAILVSAQKLHAKYFATIPVCQSVLQLLVKYGKSSAGVARNGLITLTCVSRYLDDAKEDHATSVNCCFVATDMLMAHVSENQFNHSVAKRALSLLIVATSGVRQEIILRLKVKNIPSQIETLILRNILCADDTLRSDAKELLRRFKVMKDKSTTSNAGKMFLCRWV